jgi:membrane associated rhomboid family serine protease
MDSGRDDITRDARRLKRSFSIALGFAGLLWLIWLAGWALNLDLTRWGVYPRTLSGLRGVVLSPLIHASLGHLFSNTLPVIILGTLLLYGYPRAARLVLPVVYFGTGLAVWLFARPAWHVGASGLTFGLLFFIATIGVMRWDARSIALAMVVFLLYGGMLWGVFPGNPGISFESHLAGAVLGSLLAVLLRRRDPAPARKRYSWENEDEPPEPPPWPPRGWRPPDDDRARVRPAPPTDRR